jgi:NTP pyrophosphatase (non-canonical NTP hydrolase)
MDIKLRKDFLADVEAAVVSAERKHPKICDDFCTLGKSDIVAQLMVQKLMNDKLEESGGSEWFLVVTEEVLEAVEAFIDGDYKQCLKELSQVAAVAIRGMEFVYRLTPEAKASEKFKGGNND